jgi:hypothetical protein
VTSHSLQNLISSIYTNYPNVCDVWEIVAIIEALGYTDRMIQAEFGCPDALILSQFIHAQRSQFPFPLLRERSPVKPVPKFAQEVQTFITQFSRSFIYTIPFIILLVLDYLPIDNSRDFLPPQLNSLFATVTMASLVTSSGFVQMISRRGSFYMGLKDPVQANHICIPILLMGIITTAILSFIGILFGFYQQVAADEYAILAGIYYAIMSTVWMLFAVVGIQYRFAAPAILVGMTGCFFILRVFIHLSAIESQVGIITIALISLISLTVTNSLKYRSAQPLFGQAIALPRLSILVYLLAPHFLYGMVYFGFIFADRLVVTLSAGSIDRLNIGNSNLAYQDSMDVALLNLLLIVPLVEYLSYKLIIYWYDLAKQVTLMEIDSLAWKLQQQYWLSIGRILLYFGILMVMTIILLSLLHRSYNDNILTIIACFGYLCFAIGLFNTVILLSLDRLRDVLHILVSAMLFNFCLGYIISSLFGIYFAVIGLVVGGVIFAIASSQKTLIAIERADYCYFYSGY